MKCAVCGNKSIGFNNAECNRCQSPAVLIPDDQESCKEKVERELLEKREAEKIKRFKEAEEAKAAAKAKAEADINAEAEKAISKAENRSVVEPVDDPEKKTNSETLSEDSLKEMSVKDLKELANNVPGHSKMTKEELIKALIQ